MKMTPVNKRRLMIVGAVLLVVLTIVLFSLRDVVREVIVIPLSYIFWVVGIFIRSTAQIFFWLAVLLIGLLVAWRSIRPKKKRPGEGFYRPMSTDSMAPRSPTGRVGYWVTRVGALRLGGFYQEGFNQAVSRLFIDLLAYRNHLTTRQVELALRQGRLDVPPDIAEFVRSNTRDRLEPNPNIFTWLFQSIREWFMLRFGRINRQASSQLDPQVRRVITYMQEELEVSNEQSGR